MADGRRQIECGIHENVAARVLCGDTHPDHDTICAFRRENAGLQAKAGAAPPPRVLAAIGREGHSSQQQPVWEATAPGDGIWAS